MACLQPKHPLPPPVPDHHVTTLECQAGKSLFVCPFRLTKYAFMLAAYSSCINKWAKSYSSSQAHQTGRVSTGCLTWDITAYSRTPSPGSVFCGGFCFILGFWWLVLFFGLFVCLKCMLQRNHGTIFRTLIFRHWRGSPRTIGFMYLDSPYILQWIEASGLF